MNVFYLIIFVARDSPGFDQLVDHHDGNEDHRRANHKPAESIGISRVLVVPFLGCSKSKNGRDENDLARTKSIGVHRSVSFYQSDDRTRNTPGEKPIRLERSSAQHHSNIFHEIIETWTNSAVLWHRTEMRHHRYIQRARIQWMRTRRRTDWRHIHSSMSTTSTADQHRPVQRMDTHTNR